MLLDQNAKLSMVCNPESRVRELQATYDILPSDNVSALDASVKISLCLISMNTLRRIKSCVLMRGFQIRNISTLKRDNVSQSNKRVHTTFITEAAWTT